MEKQTDAVDVTTYFTFDGAGRTTRTHLAALDQVTYLEYDLAGRQTHVKTTPDGSTIYDSETVYDAAGQRIRSVNPRGYAAYFECDPVGRLQKTKDALLNVSYFGYDAVGNRVLSVSPRDYATYFGYDGLNRLARTEDAEGVAGYFGYDANGNRTVAMVGAGAEARTTYFAFDSVNRLASVTAPDGGVTAFSYDRNGNRVSEENPLGDLTYYGYDERDLLVRVQDALGETAYYEYNEVGSLTKSTSPAGRGGNFEYDQAERRTKAYYGDGYAAYFGFDAAGNMLAAQEAAECTVYFAYDRMNRVTSQKFAAGAGGGSAYYSYDENSNRTKLIYPSGGTAYYVFDELDRMASVKAPSGNITSYEFDASGNRTKSVWGNGAYTYYEFDEAERARAIRHFKSDGTALAYFEYGRDGRGNIVRIGRLGGLTTYYSYDEADRLASETWKDAGGSTVYAYEWGYDLAGNRMSAVEQGESIAWAYNAAGAVTSRVDDSGATYYHHDLNGNLEVIEAPGGAVTYFEHGDHGLITKIKPLGGTEIYFAYDGMLRRVRVDEGSDHTYFRHDGINFIEIVNPDGTTTKVTHGHADIPGIGSVTEEETGGTSVFSIKDHRGTREAEVDASGNVTRRAFVNAFGLEIAASGAASSIFWYQGEAWWKLTVNGRLYYLSPTRIYDVTDGRCVERDIEHGLSGSYLFVHNEPLGHVDADGRVELAVASIGSLLDTGKIIKKLKDAIKEIITGTAEVSHEVFMEIADFAQAHPSIVRALNAVIDVAKPQLAKTVNQNTETLRWHDLVLIWLLELNGQKMTFDDKARTTKELMQQEGVQQAREKARKWQPGQSPINHVWKYEPNQFWTGLAEGNLCTSFLGSYAVKVVVSCDENGKRKAKFIVKNQTSWESGTRLRKRAKPGEHNQGIIPNRMRGGPGIHLGGNMEQEWSWEEEL
jgi:YD repeat-containing protein